MIVASFSQQRCIGRTPQQLSEPEAALASLALQRAGSWAALGPQQLEFLDTPIQVAASTAPVSDLPFKFQKSVQVRSVVSSQEVARGQGQVTRTVDIIGSDLAL